MSSLKRQRLLNSLPPHKSRGKASWVFEKWCAILDVLLRLFYLLPTLEKKRNEHVMNFRIYFRLLFYTYASESHRVMHVQKPVCEGFCQHQRTKLVFAVIAHVDDISRIASPGKTRRRRRLFANN